MARTTASAVALVRSVDLEAGETLDTKLATAIETANDLVTQHCVDGVQTATRLELIERWLSAHFFSLHNENRITLGETVGPITETFFQKTGFNLNQTIYGQQAMMLDASGGLANWNKKVENGMTEVTSVVWGGTERE